MARFYDFLLLRYEGDIRWLTGHVVIQVIDEFNRPGQGRLRGHARPAVRGGGGGAVRGVAGVDAGRAEVPARGAGLPGGVAVAAAGLRIRETYMLEVRDWRRDLGAFGKIHVRFGKGSRGRGAKTRLVPAINQVGDLLDWWLIEVRHQFGDDYAHPDAPLLPSERRDPATGWCCRVQDQALRDGLAHAVDAVPAGLVRKADAAYAAAFLRVVAVCPRHGPESDPGIARA